MLVIVDLFVWSRVMFVFVLACLLTRMFVR